MTDPMFDPPDAHPAIALYRTWATILDACPDDWTPFGHLGWGLERDAQGVISLGEKRASTHYFVGRWLITPDGRFKWPNRLIGATRRDRIASMVPWLSWSWTAGRYQWLVDESGEFVGWPKRWRGLLDWQDPQRYVTEDLLGCRLHYTYSPWCELKRDGGQWVIRPALDQDPVEHYYNPPADLRARWDKYERLVERRYKRLENKHRIENGLDPVVSARTPTVRAGSETLDADLAVNRLLALLEAEAPARTTRLTRPKEAIHGNNHVAPAH